MMKKKLSAAFGAAQISGATLRRYLVCSIVFQLPPTPPLFQYFFSRETFLSYSSISMPDRSGPHHAKTSEAAEHRLFLTFRYRPSAEIAD